MPAVTPPQPGRPPTPTARTFCGCRRFPRPIAYRGVHCTDRCFLDHGVYYHDRGCPVVNAYFRSYGMDPYQVYSRYAPRYDGYYDGGYSDGGYYADGYSDNGYYDNGYYDGGYYAPG